MKYFSGEISGKKLSSFSSSALENLEKYDERLKLVEGILIKDEQANDFFTTYIEQYYNASPSMTDYLSEQDAVLNLLQLFATYLLSAKDIESERKVQYKFWKSIRDFKKSEEYKSTINESQLSNGESGDNRVDVIDMFVDKKSKNSTKPKDIKITAKDIKKNTHIAELQEAIKFINSEVGEHKTKEHLKRCIETLGDDEGAGILKRVLNNYKTYMRKYVASMKEDQVLIKKAEEMIVDFDTTMDEGGFGIDWSKIDISNRKVFVELLNNLNQRSLTSDKDIDLVTYDLHHFLLNKAGLSGRELDIVKMFSVGLEQKKIADNLGFTKGTVQTYVSRIHDKVIKLGYTIE